MQFFFKKFSARHPWNAKWPMLVTLSGIVTLVKPLHLSNAESPMLITLFGIVTLIKLLQL